MINDTLYEARRGDATFMRIWICRNLSTDVEHLFVQDFYGLRTGHTIHINIINQISLNDVYVYVSPWATENANLSTENGIRNPFLKLKNDNQSNSWKWEVEVGYGDGDGVGSANCGLSKQQLWLSFVLPWGVLFIGLDLSYICIC